MKNVFKFIITFVILLGITFISSQWLNRTFTEMTFPISFISTIVIVAFSSKGGLCSEALDMQEYAGSAKVKEIKEHGANAYLKKTDFKLKMNSVVTASIVYTCLSILYSIVYYWDHF